MAHAKKRIGLILASIHTGSSLNVWPCFVKNALLENASLFIFPGGRLNAWQDSENLRNPVYSLVNRENLDGFISWSSTIRYRESAEEFEDFHHRFDPLPFVTMAYKIPCHPCVEFDAYNGMKSLVSHFISVHGGSKIAFLRGPDFHRSAVSRYNGYHDALAEAGLQAVSSSSLVSDPFNWDNGDAAAAQLFEERGLVPGRDFDTLIGASDMMVFSAVNYFANQGYHIPRDYHVGGFNNSGESKLLECPLSTVRMPYTELSSESFRIMLNLLGRKTKKIDDVLLRSELIIRESCGCTGFHLETSGRNLRNHWGEETDAVARLLRMTEEYLKLNAADLNAQTLPVIHALLSGREERFVQLFEKAAGCFFSSGGEPESLITLIEAAVASGFVPGEKVDQIKSLIYQTLFKIQERLVIHSRYEKEQWNTALNSLKCELLGTRDRNSLIQSLARHLPAIGITTAALMLWEDEKVSLCVGSFSPRGINAGREQRFPSKLLVPSNIKEQYADGIFMVQPLFIENQPLGYFIHNVSIYDGLVFEELRSAVSYALKGIALLEEMVRAKKIAEQAERAKTEFIKALETELYDPLSGVMDRLEDLERKLSPFFGDAEAGECRVQEAASAIGELKALVSSREAEASSLVDLTLARVDELYVQKQLFDLNELLPGIGVFPLLLGDTARLAQCFSLIREEYCGGTSAKMQREGLAISFRSGKKPGNRKKQGLFLAERIFLIHGGEFHAEERECTILFPWTTLTGQEPVRRHICPEDHVLVLSDPVMTVGYFFDLSPVYDIEKAVAMPGRTAFIFWNADTAHAEEFVRISALRRRHEFAALPFLCFGKSLSGKTLIDAVEHTIHVPRKRTVLVIGSPGTTFPAEIFPEQSPSPWEGVGEAIHILSMAHFNETVAEIMPSLIVVNSLSPVAAAAIRRHPLTVTIPIIMLSDRINSPVEVLSLSQYSRLILCHRSVASAPEFISRIKALMAGEEILPPHTGSLVKKTLLYFDQHTESSISRWKLAAAVNVSEDYLTRIFHRELGLSLWDYLNRYRVFFAAGLLLQTNETIQEIAFRTGFQDQAYFCRVFKKIYGSSPGQLRKPSDNTKVGIIQ
jgi:DNA-binding LacI/PurR family transcriptional regulator/AraC-like DNA-binding protein